MVSNQKYLSYHLYITVISLKMTLKWINLINWSIERGKKRLWSRYQWPLLKTVLVIVAQVYMWPVITEPVSCLFQSLSMLSKSYPSLQERTYTGTGWFICCGDMEESIALFFCYCHYMAAVLVCWRLYIVYMLLW